MQTLTLHAQNLQSDLPLHRLYRKQIHSITSQLLELQKRVYQEVSIYLVDIKKICALHEIYFNDSTQTDCISFPMDDETDDIEYRILGDVFVCPATALQYVQKHGGDPYEETTLYIVHGLLHLLGYDDLTASERKNIRKMEQETMHVLRKKKMFLLPPKQKNI